MENEEGSVDSGHSVRRNIPLMLKGSRAGRKKPSSPRRRAKEPPPAPGMSNDGFGYLFIIKTQVLPTDILAL